ncbi:hypothetical protein [Micromonospora carbonacea]|uniref:Uncharacterized protein n=1 Tax=Micromonospora carbonacea TaxID=47853 RepID=A0A7H8XHR8_9ACTN|nr:hypothetical protein [Micromonospora carbonacea]MBB5828145.1 hypothetical protein [Micromonospora carbonacea]QLD24210.1 hypothetical protein HXZ27_08265 [Micromonospora carbonacea]
MRRRCPVDQRWFYAARNGRLFAVYCRAECKAAREAQIHRAIRDLARDSAPDDPRAALVDAEVLYTWWYGTNDHRLTRQYWGNAGRPGPVHAPASPRARQALVDRIDRLRRVVDQLDREAERAEAQRRRQEATRAGQEAARIEQEAENAWRAELLAGLDEPTGE